MINKNFNVLLLLAFGTMSNLLMAAPEVISQFMCSQYTKISISKESNVDFDTFLDRSLINQSRQGMFVPANLIDGFNPNLAPNDPLNSNHIMFTKLDDHKIYFDRNFYETAYPGVFISYGYTKTPYHNIIHGKNVRRYALLTGDLTDDALIIIPFESNSFSLCLAEYHNTHDRELHHLIKSLVTWTVEGIKQGAFKAAYKIKNETLSFELTPDRLSELNENFDKLNLFEQHSLIEDALKMGTVLLGVGSIAAANIYKKQLKSKLTNLKMFAPRALLGTLSLLAVSSSVNAHETRSYYFTPKGVLELTQSENLSSWVLTSYPELTTYFKFLYLLSKK